MILPQECAIACPDVVLSALSSLAYNRAPFHLNTH